jgi:thiamine-phosphate pyrophosphorylase
MTESNGRGPDSPAAGTGTRAQHDPPFEPTTERLRRIEIVRRSPVYLVTEESLSAGRTSEEIALAALEAGVRVVQVREKEGTARRALDIALILRSMTRRFRALLLIDDRIDIALACDADGVHVGREDMPISTARRLLGPDAIVGLSITDEAELESNDARDADYLGVGAVFPTGSKADATVTGLRLLEAARAATRAPIVAIGGINAANAAQAIRAGADGLAVISAITAAPEPGFAAAALWAVAAAAGAEDTRR